MVQRYEQMRRLQWYKCGAAYDSDERHQKTNLIRMMKETNIQSQVTSTIAGDDGEAMAKSEGYVAENGFVATDPTHFGKTYHDKQSR